MLRGAVSVGAARCAGVETVARANHRGGPGISPAVGIPL
ncbi:hypothetical protein ATKI12_7101 [Kitasatospora sp. Ki12]